ncbi:Hypothetical predicted protein [Lecanosticta acicola]|uniref:Uncharacterized protein n=1 Tax=Lecanosticta acicola TaxID=111012 RepID=A0AAI8Z5X8_9PEZI|nr:Hypothetical predicted protein [Lecanosticta acicola]
MSLCNSLVSIKSKDCADHQWYPKTSPSLFFACCNPLKDYHGMFHTIYICNRCRLEVQVRRIRQIEAAEQAQPFRALENVVRFKWLMQKKLEEMKAKSEAVEGPKISLWKEEEEEEEGCDDKEAEGRNEEKVELESC